MIEANIRSEDLDKLLKKLEGSPDIIRNAKRQAFEEAAPKLKRAVDSAIGGTGKVQRWQGQFVGSKGGFAAVRPLAKTFTEPNGRGKRYAVGAVTNAINSGHKFPSPSGKDKRYRPRIRSGRQSVPGRKFYQQAEAQVPAIAQAAAQQVVAALKDHLEE